MDKSNFLTSSKDIIKTNMVDSNHIAFAVDQRFSSHIGPLIYSILKNNQNINLHFHIFLGNTSFSNHDESHYLELVKTPFNFNNFNLSVYELDTEFFEKLHTTEAFSSAMYYRFIIPNIVYQYDVDKILYLDADTLCLGSLKELFDLDISNDYVAGTLDLPIINSDENSLHRDNINKIKSIDYSIYINSGVLLFNVKKWVIDNIFDRIQIIVDKVEKEKIKLIYPDQDIINIVLEGRILHLSNQFNWFYTSESSNDILDGYLDIRILHFAGDHKPWYAFSHTLAHYKTIYNESPWGKVPLPKYSIGHKPTDVRKISKRLWTTNKLLSLKIYCEYLLKKIGF